MCVGKQREAALKMPKLAGMQELGGYARWLSDGRDPLAAAPPAAGGTLNANILLLICCRSSGALAQAAGERIGNDKAQHQVGKPPF